LIFCVDSFYGIRVRVFIARAGSDAVDALTFETRAIRRRSPNDSLPLPPTFGKHAKEG